LLARRDQINEHLAHDGPAMFEQGCRFGLEHLFGLGGAGSARLSGWILAVPTDS